MAEAREKNGRRERIRTSGPYVPNVVLYQAELLSEPVQRGAPLASGGALITMPPRPRNRAASPCRCGHFGRFADRRGSLYTEAPRPGDLSPAGASPSGKAPDFDSGMRRFDPSRPSHFYSSPLSVGIPGRSLWLAAFGTQIGPQADLPR